MADPTPAHFSWILEVFVLDVTKNPRPAYRDAQPCTNFCDAISEQVLPKIYVAVDGKEVRYVGLSTTSIATRLARGYASTKYKKNGYSGYQWLKPPTDADGLQLYVFSFLNLLGLVPAVEAVKQPHKELMDLLERIEAEVVHLVRLQSGRWPTYQNEIHFRNLGGDLAMLTQEVARQIWAALPG